MATYPYGFDNCSACGEPWPQGQAVCDNCQALPGESDVDRSLRLAGAEEVDRGNAEHDTAVAIYTARLEAAADMYMAAVHEYRKLLIRTMCDWAAEFVPTARTIRLGADVDWRWDLDEFLDANGEPIDGTLEFGEYVISDVFSPGYLSELPDIDREAYALIDIATCTFAPGTYYEFAGRP